MKSKETERKIREYIEEKLKENNLTGLAKLDPQRVYCFPFYKSLKEKVESKINVEFPLFYSIDDCLYFAHIEEREWVESKKLRKEKIWRKKHSQLSERLVRVGQNEIEYTLKNIEPFMTYEYKDEENGRIIKEVERFSLPALVLFNGACQSVYIVGFPLPSEWVFECLKIKKSEEREEGLDEDEIESKLLELTPEQRKEIVFAYSVDT